MDFISHIIKIMKYDFLVKYKAAGKNINRIIKSTFDFMSELELVSNELSKLLLIDVMTKRYLKSYLSGSVIIMACELLSDTILEGNQTIGKFDLQQIKILMESLQNTIIRFYGYNKFILF